MLEGRYLMKIMKKIKSVKRCSLEEIHTNNRTHPNKKYKTERTKISTPKYE